VANIGREKDKLCKINNAVKDKKKNPKKSIPRQITNSYQPTGNLEIQTVTASRYHHAIQQPGKNPSTREQSGIGTPYPTR
jgi:hypothetical protein